MQSLLSDHCGIKLKIINRKLLVPNVSLCCGMWIMGEIDDACVGAGVCGKSLYLQLFAREDQPLLVRWDA